MSDSTQHPSGHDHPPFKFMVDNRPFETNEPVVTGAMIKARATIDPSFTLCLEGKGDAPDRQVGDADSVDLREPGRERFYTVAPATFGAGAAM
jgi:hypothetical protein